MKRDPKPILKIARVCIKNKTPMTLTELSRRTGRSREFIKKVLLDKKILQKFISLPQPAGKIIESAEAASRMRRNYKEALNTVKTLQEELRIRGFLSEISKSIVVPTIEIRKDKGKSRATAIAMASDWHFEEEVRPEGINNLNEFNMEIAKKRANTFFERTLKLLTICRRDTQIDTMIVAALGDFIAGWIHEDLISSITPPEALVMVFEEWLAGLQFWLDNADLKEIVFVGSCGNHGRITKKPQYKKSQEKNYEWLIYQFLAKWFANTKQKTRIKFILPKGYFNRVTIYGRVLRLHHGDGIRYQGGVGGIHIPLRKAIAQWNKAQHADLDLLGHWHSRQIGQDYVVNGSLVGYNEYAERIKADFEHPLQCFFIIHSKYGKTAEFSIRL